MREGVRIREITNDEGNRLLRFVRRSSGSVVTWRRAQMVVLSTQGWMWHRSPNPVPMSRNNLSAISTAAAPRRRWSAQWPWNQLRQFSHMAVVDS